MKPGQIFTKQFIFNSRMIGEIKIKKTSFISILPQYICCILILLTASGYKKLDTAKPETENRIAEELKYPLKGKIHTPIKLYKNIYSGLSGEYFKKYFSKDDMKEISFLWKDTLLRVKYDDFFINDDKPYYQEFAGLNSSNQLVKIKKDDREKYSFLLGVQLKFTPTQNITVQTYIDKFKKDYPNLKQRGSVSNSFVRTHLLPEELVDQEFFNTASEKTAQKVRSHDKEAAERNTLKAVYMYLFYHPPQEKIILSNDNVEIVLSGNYNFTLSRLEIKDKRVEVAYYLQDVTISIIDVQLLKYRKQIECDLRNAIKEYNKKGAEKKKAKELLQLNF